MTRFLIPGIAFGLMVAVFWAGLKLDPSYVPSPHIGKVAPAFDLARLKDEDRRITDAALRGQVSLFNVWATWCVGCRQEHEMLLEIASRGDVPIFGLNWKDEREAALQWLDQLEVRDC